MRVGPETSIHPMCCSTNRSQIYSDESRMPGKNKGKSNFKRKYHFLAFDINRNQTHYDSYIMFELTLLSYAHFIVKIEILNYLNGLVLIHFNFTIRGTIKQLLEL